MLEKREAVRVARLGLGDGERRGMGALVRDLRYVSKSRYYIFIEGEYSKESSAAMREFQSIVYEAAIPNENVCR